MSLSQDHSKKMFHNQDLVLWHAPIERRTLPIPAVVVRQEESNVIIRTCSGGKVEEVIVNSHELVER